MNSMPPPYYGPPPYNPPKKKNRTWLVLAIVAGILILLSATIIGTMFVISRLDDDNNSGGDRSVEEIEDSLDMRGWREAWKEYSNSERATVCDVVNTIGYENLHEVLGASGRVSDDALESTDPEVMEQFFREVC